MVFRYYWWIFTSRTSFLIWLIQNPDATCNAWRAFGSMYHCRHSPCSSSCHTNCFFTHWQLAKQMRNVHRNNYTLPWTCKRALRSVIQSKFVKFELTWINHFNLTPTMKIGSLAHASFTYGKQHLHYTCSIFVSYTQWTNYKWIATNFVAVMLRDLHIYSVYFITYGKCCHIKIDIHFGVSNITKSLLWFG